MNDPVINISEKLKRASFQPRFKLSGAGQIQNRKIPMMRIEPIGPRLFRAVPDMQSKDGIEAFAKNKAVEDDSDQGRHILCRSCGCLITRGSARITVQGSHQHSFANPHGLVFRIGCFSTAEGCAYAGSLSNEFTWFKGYGWRIAVCGSCLVHLGWLFISDSGSSFNGLILDQLVDE